ncbi:MAG: hypothetical protein ACP5OS_04360 [Leptospirillia bacterium]
MKSPRPTLREIVRVPAVSDFIDRGVVPEAPPPEGPPGEVPLAVGLPAELHEALCFKMEERGQELSEAFREMVLDYLMKDG